MNYLDVKDFFSCYSLPTVIIAILVSLSCFLLKYFLKEKMPLRLNTYLPSIMAIFLQFLYDCLFVTKGVSFTLDTFYAGILSSSLSTIFTLVICKIIKGEKLTEPLLLLIYGLIEGYVKTSSIERVASGIKEIIEGALEQNLSLEKISNLIKEFKLDDISGEQIDELSIHLLTSASTIKE